MVVPTFLNNKKIRHKGVKFRYFSPLQDSKSVWFNRYIRIRCHSKILQRFGKNF